MSSLAAQESQGKDAIGMSEVGLFTCKPSAFPGDLDSVAVFPVYRCISREIVSNGA